MAQEKGITSIALDEILAASASGVLRALDARREGTKGGLANISAVDLVRSGFMVDFRIIAGGFPGPWLDKMLQNQAQLPMNARGVEGAG